MRLKRAAAEPVAEPVAEKKSDRPDKAAHFAEKAGKLREEWAAQDKGKPEEPLAAKAEEEPPKAKEVTVSAPTVDLMSASGQGDTSTPKMKTEVVPDEEITEFERFDRMDEQQIVSQLEGQYVERFVYQYCSMGKRCGSQDDVRNCAGGKCPNVIRDLSWIGIQEASRAMKLTIRKGTHWVQLFDDKPPQVLQDSKESDPGMMIHEFKDRVRVMVRSTDQAGKMERIGIAEGFKQMKTKFGFKDDPFYLQKAMSKAERNSLRQLLPQTVMMLWIDKFLNKPENPELDQKIEALVLMCRTVGISATKEQLESKIKTTGIACRAIDGIVAGNSEKFAKWLLEE